MQIPAAITAPAIPIPFFIRTAVPSTTSITEPAMFPSPGIASTVFVTKLRFRESNAGERIPCTTLIPITHASMVFSVQPVSFSRSSANCDKNSSPVRLPITWIIIYTLTRGTRKFRITASARKIRNSTTSKKNMDVTLPEAAVTAKKYVGQSTFINSSRKFNEASISDTANRNPFRQSAISSI